jgi:hypothetical protein
MILVIMTKKVVRKKRGNKTNRHRGRTRSRGSRRTRVKRGGMMSAFRRNIRQQIYDNAVNLLRQYQHILHRAPPQASDGKIVKEVQRYGTFADIPVDGFEWSIEELQKELENPVKNFEKINTLYDKIMKTVEEEKIKQQIEENSKKPKQSTALPFSQSPYNVVLQLSLQQPVSNPQRNRGDVLSQFIHQPFTTPNIDRHKQYSTNSVTPIKPRPKMDIREGDGLGEDEDDDEGQGQGEDYEPARHLNFMSPIRSPPPTSHQPPSLDYNKENILGRSLRF